MAPFEALYGQKCRTPLNWVEVGDRGYFGPKLGSHYCACACTHAHGPCTATAGERICQGPSGSAPPSAHPPRLLLVSRRSPGVLSGTAVLVLLPLTPAVHARGLVWLVVFSRFRSRPRQRRQSLRLQGCRPAEPRQATKSMRYPFLCIVHVWWSSGRTASCQTDHCGGGTWEGRQFGILLPPATISS